MSDSTHTKSSVLFSGCMAKAPHIFFHDKNGSVLHAICLKIYRLVKNMVFE